MMTCGIRDKVSSLLTIVEPISLSKGPGTKTHNGIVLRLEIQYDVPHMAILEKYRRAF